MAQYNGVNSRTEVCAAIQRIALSIERKPKAHYESLNRANNHFEKTTAEYLNFVKVELTLIAFVVSSDAFFVNAPEVKTKTGYISLIADKSRCASNVQYASSRFYQALQSVIAVELHARTNGLNMGTVIRVSLRDLLSFDYNLGYFLCRNFMRKGH